jgi:hypothetical protein
LRLIAPLLPKSAQPRRSQRRPPKPRARDRVRDWRVAPALELLRSRKYLRHRVHLIIVPGLEGILVSGGGVASGLAPHL